MIPQLLTKDSQFKNNFNEVAPMTSKVRVSLKEGLADRKEWAFTGYFIIGRSKSADVCIPHPHVSRLHTYVYFKEGKWWLQDLKFSNGTMVNGEKILKNHRHPMEAFTQLRLGAAGPLLHLNIEKADPVDILAEQQGPKRNLSGSNKAPSKELVVRNAAAGSKRKKIRRYLLVVAPVILFGLLLAKFGSQEKGRQPLANQNNLQAGQSLAGHGESKDNSAKPGFETTSSNTKANGAQKGGQAIADESKDEANHDAVQEQTAGLYFNAAKKLADSRHWQAALEYYHIVAGTNPEYPGLDMQITRVKSEAENKETFKMAQDLIGKGQYAETVAALSNIDSGSVYYTDAGKMRSEAETRQKQRNALQAQAAENQKAAAAIKQALSFYKKGETRAALTKMDSVLKTSSRAERGIKMRAAHLKTKIRNAKYLYFRGNKEYMSGQLVSASMTLTELIKVDKELLGDQQGLYVNGLSRKITDKYGDMAMKAYTESDFQNAFKHCKTALRFNKWHRKALNVEKMLLEKSKQLYQDGYILEEYNPEKAREKWKKVLEICSPGTDYYQKALLKIGKR